MGHPPKNIEKSKGAGWATRRDSESGAIGSRVATLAQRRRRSLPRAAAEGMGHPLLGLLE